MTRRFSLPSAAKLTLIVLLAAMIFFSSASHAEVRNFEYAGHIGGSLKGAALFDHYAFLTEGPTLAALDVADLAHPFRACITRLPFTAGKIVIDGKRAFIMFPERHLVQIYDLASPLAPRLLGEYHSSELEGRWNDGNATDLAVSGNHLYMTGDFGLCQVDISNPARPSLKMEWQEYEYEEDDEGTYDLPVWDGHAVAASGDLALFTASSEYSSEDYPPGLFCHTGGEVTSRLDVMPSAIVLESKLAYLAMGSGGLCIYDYADPAAPKLKATLAISGSAVDVKKSGNLLYLCTASGKLQIVDVSNPASPRLLGEATATGALADVSVSGTRVLAREGARRLNFFDVSNSAAPSRKGSYSASAALEAWDVKVDGNWAYVATWSGLHVFDVTKPLSPRIKSVVTTATAGRLELSGRYLYAAGAGFHILDVSNPAAPVIKGQLSAAVSDFTVMGSRVYARTSGGIQVIDVSNPAKPRISGKYTGVGVPWRIANHNDMLYGATGNGMHILNVTNPDVPSHQGSFTAGEHEYFQDFVFDGTWGFAAMAGMAGATNPLWVFDLRNPSFPVKKASLSVELSSPSGIVRSPYGRHMAMSGQVLYLDCKRDSGYYEDITNGYLLAIDVSNPVKPVLTGVVDGINEAESVAVSGRLIFRTSSYHDEGVDIFRYTDSKTAASSAWLRYQ